MRRWSLTGVQAARDRRLSAAPPSDARPSGARPSDARPSADPPSADPPFADPPFADRLHAGRVLAASVAAHLRLTDPVVLGLPRGGIPVAAEVADALGAPLEVFVARKVGAAGQPELGVAALAEGLDEPVVSTLACRHEQHGQPHDHRQHAVDQAELGPAVEETRREIARQLARYRPGLPLPDLSGRDVVLVDDGLATGITAEAAVVALRRLGASNVIVAAPVCAPEGARRLASVADAVICVVQPENFLAVGNWYRDFTQVGDEEVVATLERRRRLGEIGRGSDETGRGSDESGREPGEMGRW